MSLRSKALALPAWAIVSIATFAAPAWAQDDPTASLELLIDQSLDPVAGTALARRQSASGDLVGAVATLERIMLNHAGAEEAQLMHAGLLCRLDDPEGARAELGDMAGHPILDAHWPDIVAACGAMERPQAAGGVK